MRKMGSAKLVERIDAEDQSFAFHEHLARYKFAADHLVPGSILDIACGTGYGTSFLADLRGGLVVGVDVHWPTVQSAAKRAKRPALDRVYFYV